MLRTEWPCNNVPTRQTVEQGIGWWNISISPTTPSAVVYHVLETLNFHPEEGVSEDQTFPTVTITGWETLVDRRLGYSIAYPATWIDVSSKGSPATRIISSHPYPTKPSEQISPEVVQMSLDRQTRPSFTGGLSELEITEGYINIKHRRREIAGREALVSVLEGGAGGTRDSVRTAIPDGKKIYSIELGYPSGQLSRYEHVFEKILDSFQLIPEEVDYNDWIVYENAALGFSLEYLSWWGLWDYPTSVRFLDQSSHEEGYADEGFVEIITYDNPNNLSPREWALQKHNEVRPNESRSQVWPTASPSNISDITVTGKGAAQVLEAPDSPVFKVATIYLAHRDKMFAISIDGNPKHVTLKTVKNREIFGHMLESITFL